MTLFKLAWCMKNAKGEELHKVYSLSKGYRVSYDTRKEQIMLEAPALAFTTKQLALHFLNTCYILDEPDMALVLWTIIADEHCIWEPKRLLLEPYPERLELFWHEQKQFNAPPFLGSQVGTWCYFEPPDGTVAVERFKFHEVDVMTL